jgi:hypothetical protein
MATSWASWHILWIAGVGTLVSGLVGGGGPVPVIHPVTGAG